MKSLKKWWAKKNSVLIVAEAGINHEGDPLVALNMVTAAARAGADVVKFQSFTPSRFLRNIDPVYSIFQKCRLSYKTFKELKKRARQEGILISATPLDSAWAKKISGLGYDIIKVASGDITHLPLLARIGRLGKPVILSTGMSTESEILKAYNTLKDNGAELIALLHCVSCYPPACNELNLSVIRVLQDRFKVPIGFSDHTSDILVPCLAVAAGAKIIEKHFTLDKTMPGPDHFISLDPREFKETVKMIRHTEKCLGSPVKHPSAGEKKIKKLSRRSPVARRTLPKGTKLKKSDILYLRPEDGLSPGDIIKYFGHTLRKSKPGHSFFINPDFIYVQEFLVRPPSAATS